MSILWDFRFSRQREWSLVFWYVAPYSHVEVYRCCRGAYCLHHQDDESSPWWWRQYASLKRRSISTWLHGATSQKTLNFMSILVCLAEDGSNLFLRNLRIYSQVHTALQHRNLTFFIKVTRDAGQINLHKIHIKFLSASAVKLQACAASVQSGFLPSAVSDSLSTMTHYLPHVDALLFTVSFPQNAPRIR
jgi:hypothetical protein